tara:strand:- start:298 stop:732 length:435 start_codon:yes stop_codon:yes gene_type:complete
MVKREKLIVVLAALLLVFGACNKVKTKDVNKTITDGKWRVSYFSEDGVDETYHFNGYEFTFNDDGNVQAVGQGGTINGTWSTTDDNSNDDSSSDVDLNLVFPNTNNFDEISDDWDVVTQSNDKIELQDISGGDGSIDELTFKRI